MAEEIPKDFVMMADKDEDIKDFEKFDFIQLVVFDIFCRPMGRMFSKKKILKSVREGIATYPDLCYRKLTGGSIPHRLLTSVGDKYFRPDMSTLTNYPSPDGSPQNVGRVLCDLELRDKSLDRSSPRTAAILQLDRLREMGFVLKSAFETEFSLRGPHQRQQDLTHGWRFSCMDHIDENMDFFLEMLKELKQRNVPVESLQTETDDGYFELTLELAEGIKAADVTARLKNHVKTFSKRKGYIASFISQYHPGQTYGLGSHFNLSLWTSNGENAFLDKSKDDQLSDVARHFLAGLVKHGPGIMALSVPTVSCYRRMNLLPSLSNWNIMQKKMATFVVRETRGDNIYIEDRLPSAASNPYLVMAATLAAGMDGIRNKLPLSTHADDFQPLPGDLETALECLRADSVIVDALGGELVEHFAALKLSEMDDFEKSVRNGKDAFEHEYNLYLQHA